jgi:cardiolipin synthase A/B
MLYLTIVGGAFVAWLIIAVLFTPHIPYHLEADIDATSDHFVHVVESICQTHLEHGNRVEVLANGDRFYPAMVAAIRQARETVNLEAYTFKQGEIADRVIEALAERAKAGVRVTIVMDAIGSFGAYRANRARLEASGCRVAAYQRFTWYRLSRLNNRTHRELLIVDGEIAFVGGAGIADWWGKAVGRRPMWRDMMVRIEGPVVSDVQGVFAENWLECCGEILVGPDTYKPHRQVGDVAAFAIKSSPADRSTTSRALFQTLIEGANGKVLISTPYFLPDRAFRDAIRRTVARGVTITVDDLWAVVGTTNLDNRSFEHNDEVNVAFRSESVNARITADLEADLARSNQIDRAEWARRPLWEKIIGTGAWILERQQ